MFVGNVELLENPQSLKFCSVPSVIRLKYLGSLLSLIWKEPDFILERLFQPATWDILENWEFYALQRISSIEQGKLTDQPIQGRTHIMNGVSGDDSQDRWRFNGKSRSEKLASIIRIYIFNQHAGIQFIKGCERSFKFLQVFFRPFEFQSWDINSIHSVSYLMSNKTMQKTPKWYEIPVPQKEFLEN